MANVEVHVPKNAKTDVTLPVKKRSYSPNSKITLTMEEFLDPTTQSAIRNKYIIGPEAPEKQVDGKHFRFLYKNPTNIPVVGRVVNPNEVFFVSEDNITDPGLQFLLDKKWAMEDTEYLKSRTAKPMTATPVEKATKEGIIKKADKPSKNAKKEAPKKNEPNKVKGIENVPQNMHVHVPDSVKGETVIQKVPKAESMIVDFDADDAEAGELKFVDKEQNEAKAEARKIAKSNEEVE